MAKRPTPVREKVNLYHAEDGKDDSSSKNNLKVEKPL
jgi:hypothetical protein